MKKVVSLALALLICFMLTGCDGSQYKKAISMYEEGRFEEAASEFMELGSYKNSVEMAKKCKNAYAFEVSKRAYEHINIAYNITEQLASDIYEAWRLAIFEEEEILEGGAAHLATGLYLSAEEIKTGAAYYAFTSILDEDWNEMPEDDKRSYINIADDFFRAFEDDLLSFCVFSVIGAYTVDGTIEEAQTALNAAKAQMKELSQQYSDYEHYPNLKGYYTTASSFLNFCNNPTGTFNQMKDAINSYRKEARDLISNLNYIFEE